MQTRLCVVLIAFDRRGRERFEAIQSVARELGFEPMRVAQYYSTGMILEEVVRGICDAHLVIADLTDGNRNVYYELGIAHALGKRVVLLAEEPDQVPFSFGSSRVCRFDRSVLGLETFRENLRCLAATPGTLSPIAVFTGGVAVSGQPLALRRFSAFLFDVSIFLVPGALSKMFLPSPEWDNVFPAATIALLAYFLACSVLLRTTLGQRLTGLEVIRLDRSRPNLWQLCLRPAICLLSFGFGFVWIFRFPRHQAVHDFFTNTLVVKKSSPI